MIYLAAGTVMWLVRALLPATLVLLAGVRVRQFIIRVSVVR